MALRLPDPVIGNRKPPVPFGQFISHDHGAIASIIGECVLERIDYELGYNQTNADGLTESDGATFDITSKEPGWRLSIIETSKVLHKLNRHSQRNHLRYTPMAANHRLTGLA
jgi:hypothetical protein